MITLGLAISLLGAAFFLLLLKSYLRALDVAKWPQTSCKIIQSEVIQLKRVPHAPIEYNHKIRYQYLWNDHEFLGDRITLRENPWSTKPEAIEKLARKFPLGATLTCHVNPQSPSLAVITPESKAPGYTLWFPLIFVIGGLGIIYSHTFQKK